MADNTQLNTGTGGDIIATDDLTTLNGGAVSGFKVQRVKVGYGSDGSLRDVDASNGLPVMGVQDTRVTGTITTSTSVAGPATITNRNVVTVDISGTYAGVTFVIEASPDGTNWFPIQAMNNSTGQASTTWTPGTNATASYDMAIGGMVSLRVRATAWTSGTANVGITPQVFAYEPSVAAIAQGLAATGTAVLGNPVLVGGSDGTNARTVTTNAAGHVVINTPTRTQVNYYAVAAASGATGVETAITLTKSSGTAATTTGASFVITSGKTFRITHFSVATRGNATATIQTTTFSLRINTAGAVTTTSTPIILAARSATPATASAWDRYIIPLGDGGIEIAGNGTLQFGVTAAATFTTNAPTWDVTIIGYEY